jgi:sugar/nucleoside kinase (ribokinase family)
MASAPVGLFAGLATLDVVHRVPRPPGPDEKVQALRQDLAAGGPAANAAVAFAALGGRPVLLTALGSHPLARLVADELAGRGVTVLDATPDRAEPPAVSSVVVTEQTAQRSVVSMRGLGVTIPGVPALPATDVVLVDGHHPDLAVAAAEHGSAAGAPVLLDAGSWKDVLPEVLPHTDIAACSAVFRTPTAGSAEPDAVARDLLAHAGTVLITRGAEPVLWWQGGRRGEVPAERVTAVDTLAAGDVFHGALAFAAARTPAHADPGALQQAIAFANRVAAVRCRTTGPRAWLDDAELAELADRGPA